MINNSEVNVPWAKLILVVVLGFFLALARADVVLVPGKIEGTVQIGNETITFMTVRAYNSDDNAIQHLYPDDTAAAYSLTVNVPSGTQPTYTVQAYNIRTQDEGPTNYDYFSFPVQSAVANENEPQTVDFLLAEPPYINGTVTLTGDGELERIHIRAYPRPASGFSHYSDQWPSASDTSLISYEFPVSIGNHQCSGVAYLKSGARVTLPAKEVTVAANETASCDYEIATPETGEIRGEMTFEGDVSPNRLYAWVNSPTSRFWLKNEPEDIESYSLPDLSVGNYSVQAYAYLNNFDDYYYFPNGSFAPSRSTAIAAGDVDVIDISACQAYADGKLVLVGAASMDDVNGGQYWMRGASTDANVAGGGRVIDRIDASTGDIDLILSDGDWVSQLLRLWFNRPDTHEDGYLNERIDIYDYSNFYTDNPLSLDCGDTQAVDFAYNTGKVTVNFSVAGGGTLSNPTLQGWCQESDEGSDELLYGYWLTTTSNQTNVELGGVTFLAPQAMCTGLQAIGTVDGTQTTFGDFDIEVVGGGDVIIDIGGPGVTVASPEAGLCVTGDSLSVTGTATDDVGVVSVAVNGVTAALDPAGGEGTLSTSFSASVPLEAGENTIETVATDTSGKIGSDTRSVFKDAGPPTLQWSPANGTTTDALSIEVAGTVSDDIGVESVTVNGTEVGLTSTGTEGEYAFSVTITLAEGENSITVVAADTSDCGDDVVEVRTVTVVNNRPPEVVAVTVPENPIPLSDPVAASCEFTDPDADDTHTVSWDWGDGTSSDGSVDGRTATGTHTYAEAGLYTVSCEVVDSQEETDSGQATRQIVVFDPDGGFVTGGGWIDSPVGAYSDDASLAGKASFGLGAKYKKGAMVPTGNTQFQFRAGNLNFHAKSYQWLVILGSSAYYKGVGTINGDGPYEFMVTVIDGGTARGSDAIRVKIWGAAGPENPVYDNLRDRPDDSGAAAVLGGGSVVIHTNEES